MKYAGPLYIVQVQRIGHFDICMTFPLVDDCEQHNIAFYIETDAVSNSFVDIV